MPETPLGQHIASLIAETGPIPLSQYMAIALGHPKHGYYMTRDPLGRAGDFTTAPEISQMFGELMGLWLADQWIKQGCPSPINIVELGPGRGTLMADALRALRNVPAMLEQASIHLVETSPVLRDAQKHNVPDAIWHDRIDTLPGGPLFLIANEFFDALPITQYQRTERGWCERHVGYENGRITPMLAPVPVAWGDALPAFMKTAEIGAIAELSPASTSIAGQIAAHISRDGGAAVIVDYGHMKNSTGDTLQAVQNHQYADPFESPGEADLTAHVDFEALALAAKSNGAAAYGPVEQGAFLKNLGIESRAEMLSRKASPTQKTDIRQALHRLTSNEEMGSLFKVLGIIPRGGIAPAGFGEE